MIPCVSGKCILRACTSRRFRPLSATAVLRPRWMNSSFGCVGVVWDIVTSSLSRSLGRGLRRRLLLDLLDDAGIADLAAPVGVDEPSAASDLLRAPAPRLVIGLRVRH